MTRNRSSSLWLFSSSSLSLSLSLFSLFSSLLLISPVVVKAFGTIGTQQQQQLQLQQQIFLKQQQQRRRTLFKASSPVFFQKSSSSSSSTDEHLLNMTENLCLGSSVTSVDEEGAEEKPHSNNQTTSLLSPLLSSFELYGWRPDNNLPADENYMDLVLLLTRNSQLRQGGMGCVLVSPQQQQQKQQQRGDDDDDDDDDDLMGTIIAASTNAPLFAPNDSDVHAEIVALANVARQGQFVSTLGCTAYITMPPCKRCFAALCVSGIRRIVTTRQAPDVIAKVAQNHGVELVDLSSTFPDQRSRVSALVSSFCEASNSEDSARQVFYQRKRRKEEKAKRKANARQKI